MTTTRAKLFRNGGSQAVRLPKDCRFSDRLHEVAVRREGDKIILEPVDDWSPEFLACLGALDSDLERPPQPPITKLRDPFR